MRLMIDGIALEVESGTTILAAARQVGIEIPTLCHLEGLAPQTSCFICVVQVTGNENFLPACATLCAEGMAVSTNSPEVREIRRTALELLLSDHAGRCLDCGEIQRNCCRLRALAVQYHAHFSRFGRATPNGCGTAGAPACRDLNPDTSHPEIVYEPGKCILCGLCIKIAEQAGEALGLCFVGRGFTTRMTPALGADLARALTHSARACAEACPSGALTLVDDSKN